MLGSRGQSQCATGSMTDESFQTMRRAMVASQLRTNAVTDAPVLAAMGTVPREAFLPANRRAMAYVDTVVPLGHGRGLNPPMTTGRLLSEIAPRAGERALVVGAGPGYSAAVLAEIGVAVTALEEPGATRPTPGAGVTAVEGPLAAGWAAGAPYDLILIDGAVEDIPEALVTQLRDGGRLAAARSERGVTRLVIGRRAGDGFGAVAVADAEAAPLPGFAPSPIFTF